ncbi:MAG: hypothetical protein RL373_912 [Pseudomonadota bacterium]|jgi:predicted RNase H-like HicB family nuclease
MVFEILIWPAQHDSNVRPWASHTVWIITYYLKGYYLLKSIIERIIFTLRKGALMLLTAILSPVEEGGYIALNPETGTTTQGETVDEAIANLKEATSLYLEEFPMTFNVHPLVTTFDIAHA